MLVSERCGNEGFPLRVDVISPLDPQAPSSFSHSLSMSSSGTDSFDSLAQFPSTSYPHPQLHPDILPSEPKRPTLFESLLRSLSWWVKGDSGIEETVGSGGKIAWFIGGSFQSLTCPCRVINTPGQGAPSPGVCGPAEWEASQPPRPPAGPGGSHDQQCQQSPVLPQAPGKPSLLSSPFQCLSL